MKELVNIDARNRIMNIEEKIFNAPNAISDFPLTHSFADGMYVREISVPKGFLVATKIHKKEHPCFVLKGKCLVLSEDGVKMVTAPHSMITKAGTKRIVFVLEDTIWATVHKTDHTDLDEIEDEVIAKNFDDLDNVIDVKTIDIFIGAINEGIV